MNIALLSDKVGWHLSVWADVVGQRDDVKVFLSDPSQHNVEMVRSYVGERLARVYPSPEALFRENEIEIAIVDTAPVRTPDLVQAALEASIPVIVEKPGATSPEAYAPLVKLANSKGLLLAMSLMESPAVQEAARIVAEGTLGRIYSIHYMLVDHQRWRIRDQMAWVYSKREAGGGQLGHEFCHSVHCMRRILGQEVTHVTGFAEVVSGEPLEVEDSVAMSVRFANGAIGALFGGSWGPSVKGVPEYTEEMYRYLQSRFSVWGEKGAVHADTRGGTFVQDLQYEGPPGPVPTTPLTYRAERPLLVQRSEGDIPQHGGRHLGAMSGGIPKNIGATAVAVFLQECIDSIRGQGPQPIANDAGLRFLEVQHALYRASETGETQQLGQRGPA